MFFLVMESMVETDTLFEQIPRTKKERGGKTRISFSTLTYPFFCSLNLFCAAREKENKFSVVLIHFSFARLSSLA